MNIDEDIADIICSDSEIKKTMIDMPYLNLEVSENFSGMEDSSCCEILYKLKDNFNLWLDDFGSGNANFSALRTGLFNTVKIDKNFYWKNFNKPIWNLLIKELRKHTNSIIVEGIETKIQLHQLGDTVDGLQGYLFPHVHLDEIKKMDLFLRELI